MTSDMNGEMKQLSSSVLEKKVGQLYEKVGQGLG